MARFRLRIFQGSNIPRTQASYMPRTPSCMPRSASCMPKHQLLGFQYALVAVGSCLRRFYFLKTGVPFHTKALVAVGSCLRRFYFLKTGPPFQTKALVAVEGCLRRFYFLKTGPPYQTKALVAVEGCLRRLYFLKTQAVGGGVWGHHVHRQTRGTLANS